MALFDPQIGELWTEIRPILALKYAKIRTMIGVSFRAPQHTSNTYRNSASNHPFQKPQAINGISRGPRRDFKRSANSDTGNKAPQKTLDGTTIAKLRDEGLCFKCRKPGNIGRNCPGSHSVEPPGLWSNPLYLR